MTSLWSCLPFAGDCPVDPGGLVTKRVMSTLAPSLAHTFWSPLGTRSLLVSPEDPKHWIGDLVAYLL